MNIMTDLLQTPLPSTLQYCNNFVQILLNIVTIFDVFRQKKGTLIHGNQISFRRSIVYSRWVDKFLPFESPHVNWSFAYEFVSVSNA